MRFLPWASSFSFPWKPRNKTRTQTLKASSAPRDVGDILARMLNGEAGNADLYSADLVASGVPDLVMKKLSELTQTFGSVEKIHPVRDRYDILFKEAVVRVDIRQDDDGRLSSMVTGQPAARGTFNTIAHQITTLPGKTALYVETERTVRIAHMADEPLAIASAFKLVVLAALNRKQVPMDTVLPLRPDLKSLPSGILQEWPDNSLMTVQTLANLMISQSDNTATDLLIHHMGKAILEDIAPVNRPFLTTREAFLLKGRSRQNQRARWQEADLNQRSEIIANLVRQGQPSSHDVLLHPTLDIEWFLTARELADLLNELRGHPSLAINPGPLNASDWLDYAYKGGSEPGALNFSMDLLGHDNRRHMVVVTWNAWDTPVDLNRLLFLTGGLLNQL